MTYCVGMLLDAGLVFLSDSRTNAGVDQISTFRKVTIFEKPGDRVMVLLTAGNLAISQSVVNVLHEHENEPGIKGIWTSKNMFEAALAVGEALREVHKRDADALKDHHIEFNASLIFGGQIGTEAPRLFCIYAAGIAHRNGDSFMAVFFQMYDMRLHNFMIPFNINHYSEICRCRSQSQTNLSANA